MTPRETQRAALAEAAGRLVPVAGCWFGSARFSYFATPRRELVLGVVTMAGHPPAAVWVLNRRRVPDRLFLARVELTAAGQLRVTLPDGTAVTVALPPPRPGLPLEALREAEASRRAWLEVVRSFREA
jgi:hypothetical protein